MKKLTKYEYCRRWLNSGKVLTQRIAWINWEFASFRRFIDRERKRLRKEGKDIVNVSTAGNYAKYIHSDFLQQHKTK